MKYPPPNTTDDCTCPIMDSGEVTHGENCPLYKAPEQADAVKKVLALIHALPTMAELEAQDIEGEEFPAYLAQLRSDVAAARGAYDALTPEEKAEVDADTLAKLIELEDILAAMPVVLDLEDPAFNVIVVSTSGATGDNSTYTIITETSPSTPEKTAATAKAGETVSVTLSTTRNNRAPQAVQFCNALTNIIEIEGHPITRSYDNPSVFTFTMPAQKVNLAITFGTNNMVQAKQYYEPSGTATPASADNITPAVVYTSADPLSGQFMAGYDNTIDGYLYKFSDGNDYGTVDFSGTHLVYTPNADAANKTVFIHVKAFSGGGISGGAGGAAYVEHNVTVGALPIPDYSKDVSLKSLTYQIADGADGTVELESDTYEYRTTLPFGTVIGKEITLQPTLTDSTANVSATTSGTTSYAVNNATVTVTAQDPSVVKEYKVHFHVAPGNVPYSVTNKDTGVKYVDDDTILINTESIVKLQINHGSGISGTGAVWVTVEDSSVLPYVSGSSSGIYPNTLLPVELKAAKAGDTKLFVKFYAERGTNFEGKTPIATITLNLVQHKPVTDISGVPTAATVGTDLALTGTVAPADATNKVIAWSIKDAGTTNATIVEGELKTTAAGTVKVTAAITNGLTASSSYIKEFDITVSADTLAEYSGPQAAPPSSTPTAKTAESITLAAVTVSNETVEYAKSTSSTAPSADSDWQTSTAFTGLVADTRYYFFARVKDNATHEAGSASAGTAITTDKSDAQKLAAAKPLAETAVANLTATNSTTAANILLAVNAAIASIPDVTATWKAAPTITPATDSGAGSITGTIKLICGGETVEVTVNKTIAQLGGDTEKVANAKAAAVAVLDRYTATNTTTDSDIMALVNTAITDSGITGVTAEWKSSNGFDKNNATTSAGGNVTGTITLKLNSATADVILNLPIAQLAADKTALISAIADANTAKYGIAINDNAASSVASGTRFVTTAEMNALTDAIAAAQAVANNSASTATQVNDAVNALNNAVTAFNTAIKTGTYSGGSSGGGGSSSGGTTTTPPSTNPTEPVTGTSNASAAVDNNGNTTVNVTDQNISDAVKAAQDTAAQKGGNTGEVTAVINVTSPADSNPNTVSVNLPKAVQEQVINSKIGNVAIVIDKPDISIGMTLATITEMNKQANADIQISATRTDANTLSTEAKNTIGSRPAFDLKATYASGSKSVTNFGTGIVSIAIPYTLQPGEIAGGMYAVYVDEGGKVSYITNSSYDVDNKLLRFSTNHFSVYGVGYKAPVGFTDIVDHWAKTDIEFAVNRGLMNNTSDTTFEPNGSMTRGMFVTDLGRLAGVDVDGYKTGKFTDVMAGTYYAPYVNWAAEKGIVKGITDTTFAPDQVITRQEMAVIMSSYANAQGYQVPETRTAVTFADDASIASWAAPAVKQMQMAGILHSKDGNRLDPTGTATRGEASAMLHRYVALVIDRITAEGWTINDSGSALYYQDGKAVTGTKTIGTVAYTFNDYGETTQKAATTAATIEAALPADGKKYITLKIVKGDTLWNLAKKHGTTVNAIVALNNIQDQNIILEGREIKIPQK